jgi:enoyl-CoA hydratase/carnithine racemase
VLVIRSDGPNFCMGGNVPEWPGKSAPTQRRAYVLADNKLALV